MSVHRHDKALEGVTICGEIRGQERFTPVIQGLSMDDPQLKVGTCDTDHMKQCRVCVLCCVQTDHSRVFSRVHVW